MLVGYIFQNQRIIDNPVFDDDSWEQCQQYVEQAIESTNLLWEDSTYFTDYKPLDNLENINRLTKWARIFKVDY